MSYAEPAWQRADREFKNAAELDPAWRRFARLAMMNALLGFDERPVETTKRPAKHEGLTPLSKTEPPR